MIKNNQDTAPLLKVVVPPRIHAFPQIPKTLIFLEDVEAGIRLGNELQYRLTELTRINPSVAIVNYYSTLDAESKSELPHAMIQTRRNGYGIRSCGYRIRIRLSECVVFDSKME